MIAIPFIYFSILLAYIIRKKRTFDISAYLVSLYLISSFFSILVDANNLRYFDTKDYKITLIPTILYCFLLTITIWPFFRFKSEKIVSIRLYDPNVFNKIVYFFFVCFLLISISSFGSIFKVLTGDLEELRNVLSRGESSGELPSIGGPLKPFYLIAGIFGGYSLVMLLFYFYSICFLQRSKVFNSIILVSSMSIIVLGILGIDRSKTTYWLISYGFMLVFFWRYMPKKQRKSIFKISLIFAGLVTAYFVAVTVSRFGEKDAGSEGGMISYAGQSFINFCFFFDKVEYKEFSLQRIFPLFYKLFINNGIESSVELNTVISLQTGKAIGVFSTFIGDIMIASGKIAAIIYCFIFTLIASKFTKFKNSSQIYFHELLIVFCLITVPLLGIFVHFYAGFPMMIALLFFIFYFIHLKLKLKKNNS
ncbi:MAG: O-antigen polymerase [Ferruginibacter sp.]